MGEHGAGRFASVRLAPACLAPARDEASWKQITRRRVACGAGSPGWVAGRPQRLAQQTERRDAQDSIALFRCKGRKMGRRANCQAGGRDAARPKGR